MSFRAPFEMTEDVTLFSNQPKLFKVMSEVFAVPNQPFLVIHGAETAVDGNSIWLLKILVEGIQLLHQCIHSGWYTEVLVFPGQRS